MTLVSHGSMGGASMQGMHSPAMFAPGPHGMPATPTQGPEYVFCLQHVQWAVRNARLTWLRVVVSPHSNSLVRVIVRVRPLNETEHSRGDGVVAHIAQDGRSMAVRSLLV